ncbi:cell envelope integrity protein TolA [Lacinutrix chionoecetis]
MKYLETKHEQNSAKITTLIVVIMVLLCFVVGQSYQDPPEEYGVAINFGNASAINEESEPSNAEALQEFEPEPEEVSPEEIIEEESTPEETIPEETEEALEKAKEIAQEEAKAAEEAAAAEAAAEAEAEAEKLLMQEAEEALKVKKAEEAREAKKAKEKLEKEALEAKEKQQKEAEAKKTAEAEAKKIAEAKVKAEKEAEAKRAIEAKKKADKAASDARQAEAARIAKANAEAASKKAAADAAAASAAKNKGDGNKPVPFALIENAPIYPGCEGGNNDAKKRCMNEKIKQFLGDNFNRILISDLGLTGIQKINIFFKIDETGKVVGIRAKAPDSKLEQEARRVANLLPKMKPGMQQGRPVAVSFYLPLSIKAN